MLKIGKYLTEVRRLTKWTKFCAPLNLVKNILSLSIMIPYRHKYCKSLIRKRLSQNARVNPEKNEGEEEWLTQPNVGLTQNILVIVTCNKCKNSRSFPKEGTRRTDHLDLPLECKRKGARTREKHENGQSFTVCTALLLQSLPMLRKYRLKSFVCCSCTRTPVRSDAINRLRPVTCCHTALD